MEKGGGEGRPEDALSYQGQDHLLLPLALRLWLWQTQAGAVEWRLLETRSSRNERKRAGQVLLNRCLEKTHLFCLFENISKIRVKEGWKRKRLLSWSHEEWCLAHDKPYMNVKTACTCARRRGGESEPCLPQCGMKSQQTRPRESATLAKNLIKCQSRQSKYYFVCCVMKLLLSSWPLASTY